MPGEKEIDDGQEGRYGGDKRPEAPSGPCLPGLFQPPGETFRCWIGLPAGVNHQHFVKSATQSEAQKEEKKRKEYLRGHNYSICRLPNQIHSWAVARGDAEEGGHLFVEEALARAIGLDPFAIEDKLRDGMFADVGEQLVGSTGRGVYIDLFVGDGPVVKEAFGSTAVAAPGGRIDEKFHRSILLYGLYEGAEL
jgi:hypothetical protein